MGDRANIVIEQGEAKETYLYTHWGGTELPQTLHAALSRRVRWEHDSYLARIIFCEMIGDDMKGETGFGISTEPPDNEYPYLRVNCDTQHITVDFDPVRQWHDYPNLEFSFEEYIALPCGLDWERLGMHYDED